MSMGPASRNPDDGVGNGWLWKADTKGRALVSGAGGIEHKGEIVE